MNIRSLFLNTGILLLIFSGNITLAQQDFNVIGGVSLADDTIPPHPSAILDIRSVSKGVLIPEMTAEERDNIVNPAEGLMLYIMDTTEFAGIWYYSGGWQQLKFRRSYYPKGSIIMYCGPTSSTYFDPSTGAGVHPSTLGWHICNGKDGTPDLSNRFVAAMDLSTSPKADYRYFGNGPDVCKNSFTLGEDSVPEHKHNITETTVSQSFNHTHTLQTKEGSNQYTHYHDLEHLDDGRNGDPGFEYRVRDKAKESREYFFETEGLGLRTEENTESAAGSLSLTLGETGSENPVPIDNRPAYYLLVYIMRTEAPYSPFNTITDPNE